MSSAKSGDRLPLRMLRISLRSIRATTNAASRSRDANSARVARVRQRQPRPHRGACVEGWATRVQLGFASSLRAKRSNPGPQGRAGLLRRFAPRNDVETQLHILATLLRPSCCKNAVPLENRGRGEDRVRAAPAVSCAKCAFGKNAHEHTGSAESLRPSLRNGVTAYIVLSPVSRACLPPSLPRSVSFLGT